MPTIINQIPDTIYSKFIDKLKDIDVSILYRISEIKYDPNEVDQKRFLLLMKDGNYIYITLNTFNRLNLYYEIVGSFDNKRGILYLDSGDYVKFFDE